MVKTRRARKGGAYIGEGSFGCAFRPALPCEGSADRTPNTISKLLQAENADKEFEIHDILYGIDPTQQYFLYPKRKCQVNVPRLEVSNRMNQCTLLNPTDPRRGARFRMNMTNTKVIEYPDGGRDLEKFELKQNNYYDYFKGFENLLDGLSLLHAMGYYHLDIKPANLVAKKTPMDARGHQRIHMRFIDFGFLSKAETLRANLEPGILRSMYPIWPMDMVYTSVLPGGERLITDEFRAERLMDRYKEGASHYYSNAIPQPLWYEIDDLLWYDFRDSFNAYQALGRGVDVCRSGTRTDCGHMGITQGECEARGCCWDPNPNPNPEGIPYCYRASNREQLEDLKRLKAYLPKVDIFSLGIVMAKEFARRVGIVKISDVEYRPAVPVAPANQAWFMDVIRRVAAPFYTLIEKMISIDFRRRISPVDALAEYRLLLPAMEELFTTDAIRTHLSPYRRVPMPSPLPALPPSPPSPPSPPPPPPPPHMPLQRQQGVRRLVGGKTYKRKNSRHTRR
jgi:serine/threonine protein kinase